MRPRPAVTASPLPLTEANLNGATLAVGLPNGFAFASGVSTSSFTLDTSPTTAGLSIGNVTGGASGTRNATLSLVTGAGYGFSTAATLAVRVLAAAHSGSTDMTSATLSVSRTPGITLSRRSLALKEDPGTTNAHLGTYTVVLDSPPTGCTAVLGAITGDNADITVSPNICNFNTTGQLWSRPQTVTVTAAQDGDSTHDTATITHTIDSTYNCPAAGYTTPLSLPSLTVTVNDD